MKFCSEAIVQEKRRKWIVKDKKEYTGTSVVHDPYTDTCTARRDVAQSTHPALLPGSEANTQLVLHSCPRASCWGA